ncbi:MAG: histidine kinase dimerization/phospho-acceptor domain-containing protein, partial [Anaerolineae bacterium]|nr:histidine kinase dimerization/phospho-acceptor domain-containing protein [Anaerolineae bacterium]
MSEAVPLSTSVEELREQLRQYAGEQALLLEITRRIAKGGTLETVLTDIAQIAQRGLRAACLRFVVTSSTALQAYCAEGSDNDFARFDAPLLAVAQHSNFEATAEAPLPQPLNELRSLFGAVAAVPLTAREAPLGILWVAYREAHAFGAWERNFLQLLAAQAAIAIANARSFEAARRGREQLAAILRSSLDPILVVDTHEQILVFNPAAERAFGISAERVIGNQLSAFANMTQASDLIALLRGEASAEGMEWQSANGLTFAPRLSEMHDERGERSGSVLMLRDITRYKNLRDNQAEFTSTVSHDLRLPLTYMKGYVDMLPTVGELNERQRVFTEKIQNGIKQMSDLVEKILDASRLDPEGNYRLHREPCDILKMVSEVVATHAAAAEKNSQTLLTETAPNIPILHLDDTMMRRALNNLTDNAIKYTPPNGTITVRAEVRDNTLLLSVRDTGRGISPEDQRT